MKLKLLSSSVNPTTLSFVITTSAVLYNGFSTQSIILLVASLCLAFVLSMSMGANDVANSFGTSVGSGALTLRQALVLASIFETIGATTLGYKVASMIRKSIFNISIFDGKLDDSMSADRIASAISVAKSFDVLIELPILTICVKLLCFANLRCN
ncbi:hypothetical protein A3Q56_00049 [Intoshia linei]|uniref:Uncharacterized protein n=1 Tax=Intoshia linei TaxID=1819745 RepID=A0A177BD78_9BILA|nr:hypothetical protein A3Q56_00049 [Intoshia linei]